MSRKTHNSFRGADVHPADIKRHTAACGRRVPALRIVALGSASCQGCSNALTRAMASGSDSV